MNAERYLFDVDPAELEQRQIMVPYQNIPFAVEGKDIVAGPSGNGMSYGELVVRLASETPLDIRILDVTAEISAIYQAERPEDAPKIKLLELDLLLLNAHKEHDLSREIAASVVAEGIETIEEKIHDTYEVMSEEPIFIEQFSSELETAICDTTSLSDVDKYVKQAFDHIITTEYNEEEVDALRVQALAREIKEDLGILKAYLNLAKPIAPEIVERAEEQPVTYELAQQALVAA